MNKKKCLICIIGLPRTYPSTFAHFYNNVIKHNQHEYDFDIITHTYSTVPGINELYSKMCSNYYSINKDILIDANVSSSIMFIRIMECYKHVHNKLNIPYYDVYMTVRFDLLIHYPVSLRNLESNMVCLLDHRCDGPGRRFHDVSDRDWDFSFIGKHEVFKHFVSAIDEYFVQESDVKYNVNLTLKNTCVKPRWTSKTCPAFIHPFYNGQNGPRMVNGYTYECHTRGIPDQLFTKLTEMDKCVDFKWSIHNCFIGHLIR